MKITTIKPGYIVVLMTNLPTKLKTYVGEVQEVDDMGVRITLVQWLTGTATGDDLFVTWPNIIGAAVATEDHDLSQFNSAKWQDLAEEGRDAGAMS